MTGHTAKETDSDDVASIVFNINVDKEEKIRRAITILLNVNFITEFA